MISLHSPSTSTSPTRHLPTSPRGRLTTFLFVILSTIFILFVFSPSYEPLFASLGVNIGSGSGSVGENGIDASEVGSGSDLPSHAGLLAAKLRPVKARPKGHPFDETLLPLGLHYYLFSHLPQSKPYPVPTTTPSIPTLTFDEDPQSYHDYDDWKRVRYRVWNHRELVKLGECMGKGNCVGEETVVIFGAHWVREAELDGWRGGEGVWSRSLYRTCLGLGYTCLMGESNYKETLWMYRLFPELVKIVLQPDTGACQHDPDCVYSNDNEDGIPAWKLFDQDFFPEMWASSVLGGPWVVNAELAYEHPLNPKNQTYLGYSVEEDSMTHPIVPMEERANRAWVFAKSVIYFYEGNLAWPRDFYTRLQAEPSLGLKLEGGYKFEPGWGEDLAVAGIDNHGILGPEKFLDVVSGSKVLIGVGDPLLSPTPYVALGQGVPFINPIFSFDPEDPDNCEKWQVQHQSLKCQEAPYVYHVRTNDYDGLLAALKSAATHPIDRYFMPWNTQEALTERFETFVNADWKAEARRLLDERIAGGSGDEQKWFM